VFVIVDAFPLTPNGKIDRKALPSPTAAAEPESSRSVAAPRNETEAKLVEIWKQVLGLKEVGIDCDIFDVGGDSILIFQISTRATRAGLSVPPADVFRHRNIAALAAALSSAESPTSTPTIRRANRDAYRRQL